MPEIWPTNARLRGSDLANAAGRVSGIVCPFAVAALHDSVGVIGVFALLSAVSILVAVVIGVIGIETRGVSAEVINAVDEN